MLRNVNAFPRFLFSIEDDASSEHPKQAAALQAFQADDWESFEALTLGDNAALPLNKVRFANNQNCLHLAIQSGRWSIALQLAKRPEDWVRDLVNQRDSFAHTPLTMAVDAETEHPELVDALINAGTHYGLSDALEAAATHGHVLSAKRLLETDIDAPEVLADLLRFGPSNRKTVKAAELLISLGVDVTAALHHVMQNHAHSGLSALLLLGMASDTVLRMLLLLGASGSRALAETALQDVTRDLDRAIESGVDVPATLRLLAKLPPSDRHAKAMARLIAEDERVLLDNKYVAKPRGFTTALLQLVKTGETSRLPTLCAVVDTKHRHEGCDALADHGEFEAIHTLIAADLVQAEHLLVRFALTGRFVAVKSLLAPNVNVLKVLQQLTGAHNQGSLKSFHAIQLLLLAGADASPLPALHQEQQKLFEKQATISRLTDREKTLALSQAATTENMVETVMALNSGADEISVLKQLHLAKDSLGTNVSLGIGALIRAGVDPCDMLITCIKAGHMDLARTLIQAKEISAQTLNRLIKKNEWSLAGQFIPALTDGQAALIQAAQDDNPLFANALMALGASGPKALASLLDSGIQTEAVGRLITWGADIHLARLYAVDTRSIRERRTDIDLTRIHSIEINGVIKWATREQLDLLGADLAIALIRTLDHHDIDTARQITTLAPRVGPQALWNAIEDKTLAHDVKKTRLQGLLALQINANEALEQLASMDRIEEMRLLIGLGVPTARLLIDLTQRRQHSASEKLIMAGADFGTAITDLHANHNAQAATHLTMALTKARDNAIAARNASIY